MDAITSTDPDRRPTRSVGRTVARCLWWSHLLLVVLVGGFTLMTTTGAQDDANIGLGLGLMALGGLGLPWTLPVVSGTLDGGLSLDSPTYVLVVVAGTLLNLALHAGALRLWDRLRGRVAQA